MRKFIRVHNLHARAGLILGETGALPTMMAGEVLTRGGKSVQMSILAPFMCPFPPSRPQAALAIPAFIPSYGIAAHSRFPLRRGRSGYYCTAGRWTTGRRCG